MDKYNNDLIPIRVQERQLTISSLDTERLEQLTRRRPTYYEPLQQFEQLVEQDATVVLFLPMDSYEYPLFGEYLTRKLKPINAFDSGIQPIPMDADYLLYALTLPCVNLPEDIYLGADWYLQRLTETNRQCSE